MPLPAKPRVLGPLRGDGSHSSALRRTVAASLCFLVSVAPTAASAIPDACVPSGDEQPLYASAAFVQGKGQNAHLVGNAFSVSARPGPACSEPSPPDACKGKIGAYRQWNVLLMTAAHVVVEVCAGAPGEWKERGDGEWQEGYLVIYPGYKLEAPVVIPINEAWCAGQTNAFGQIVPPDPAANSGKRVEPLKIAPAASDIYLFAQDVLIPERAIMIPFAMDVLPRKLDAPAILVRGFLPEDYSLGRTVLLPDGSALKYASSAGEYPVAEELYPKYPLKLDARWGQSGSPVGRMANGRYSVFGVLTDTGKTTCLKYMAAQRAKEKADAQSRGETATEDAETDGDKLAAADARKCSNGPVERAALKDLDNTAYFVPVFRYPSWYVKQKEYNDSMSNARINAAINLYKYMGQDSAISDETYQDAFKEIFQRLSPVEQMFVLQKAGRNRAFATPDMLACSHLEPTAPISP